MATTAMAGRWLLKTEPEEWSWEHQQANGGVSHWDGVRNAQAQQHLRAMANGDLCFFYHSGAKAKEIVGIARVCKTFYPDPSDPASKHGMIDIEAVSKLALPLPLSRLKQEDRLHSFIMFRQPRLSIVPVGSSEWELICELAGELEPPLPLDNGAVSLKVCNGEALSSDDDETRVSLRDTIDKLSQPSSVHTRARRKRPKVKSFIDGSRVKAIGAVITSEGLRPRVKARVADVKTSPNLVEQNCLDEPRSHNSKLLEDSQATELAPDAKRVYSRRNRKPSQSVHEGETHTFCENLQFAAQQEAEKESMLTDGKISDSRAMVSDAGRVYKKRNRKQKLVESLL